MDVHITKLGSTKLLFGADPILEVITGGQNLLAHLASQLHISTKHSLAHPLPIEFGTLDREENEVMQFQLSVEEGKCILQISYMLKNFLYLEFDENGVGLRYDDETIILSPCQCRSLNAKRYGDDNIGSPVLNLSQQNHTGQETIAPYSLDKITYIYGSEGTSSTPMNAFCKLSIEGGYPMLRFGRASFLLTNSDVRVFIHPRCLKEGSDSELETRCIGAIQVTLKNPHDAQIFNANFDHVGTLCLRTAFCTEENFMMLKSTDGAEYTFHEDN